jgi:hypothetical protein
MFVCQRVCIGYLSPRPLPSSTTCTREMSIWLTARCYFLPKSTSLSIKLLCRPSTGSTSTLLSFGWGASLLWFVPQFDKIHRMSHLDPLSHYGPCILCPGLITKLGCHCKSLTWPNETVQHLFWLLLGNWARLGRFVIKWMYTRQSSVLAFLSQYLIICRVCTSS